MLENFNCFYYNEDSWVKFYKYETNVMNIMFFKEDF